jgi:acetylornithine deacetylase/succinyl-diaminopimelate desuccinylase-like protein
MASESLWRPAVLEILQELIRTPSVNPSLSPDEAHGEGAIAKVAQGWLTANGTEKGKRPGMPERPLSIEGFRVTDFQFNCPTIRSRAECST